MFYLILFSVTTILFYIAQVGISRSKIFFYTISYISIFLLAFVAGARDNCIGTDINIYGAKVFSAASSEYPFSKAYNAVSNVSELLYFIINWISAKICNTYGLSLFLQMFIQSTFVFLGMKRYMDKVPLWFTMLVYQLYFYNLSLNLMRQCIAMAFIFWAFKFLERKQLKKFLFCAIISFFFHKTGLIASVIILMIYWAILQKEHIQRILLFVAIGVSIVGIYMFTLAIEYLSNIIPEFAHFLAYAEGSGFKAGISTMDVLLRVAFVVMTIFFYNNNVLNKSQVNMFLFFLIVDMASLILGKYAYFTTRFAYYFIIIEIPYAAMLLYSGKLSRGTLAIASTFFILFFVYYCVRFNYVEGNNATYPYKSSFLSI